MPHVQHHYFSSFNQSYHWFVTLPFLKLPNSKIRDENTKRYVIYLVSRGDYVSSLLIGKKALIQNRAQSKKWPVFNAHAFSYAKSEIFPLITNYNIDKTAPAGPLALKYLKWESLGSSSTDISYGRIRWHGGFVFWSRRGTKMGDAHE